MFRSTESIENSYFLLIQFLKGLCGAFERFRACEMHPNVRFEIDFSQSCFTIRIFIRINFIVKKLDCSFWVCEIILIILGFDGLFLVHFFTLR